jgi:hypothetical protein
MKLKTKHTIGFVLIILSAVKVNKVTYARFKTWLKCHKPHVTK